MSRTEKILDQLASEGGTRDTGYAWRFALPLVIVLAAACAAVALIIDGAFAGVAIAGLGPILVKWGFSLTLVLLAPVALWTLGRPGRKSGWILPALILPFALIFGVLVLDLSINAWPFPGETWPHCLAAMTILSPLAFAGATFAMRVLAPVKLRRAGLVAGLFGGAVAMTAYAPFCPERGMLYLAVFYCLPILAMAGIGWLMGPKLLRW